MHAIKILITKTTSAFFAGLTLTLNAELTEPLSLFDQGLEHFDVWMGVPHKSVPGLPEGTYQSDNVHKGEPLGINNDLKNVFSIIEEDGTPILAITGEIYG